MIPYNVYRHPNQPFFIPSEAISIDDLTTKVKDYWGKYGDISKDLVTDVWNFYKKDKIDYLQLTKDLISVASFFPEVSAFVPYVNKFLDFIWPQMFGGSETPSIFEQLKPQIEELVKTILKQELTHKQINFLDQVQAGILNAMSTFNEEVKKVQENPTPQHISDLHSAVISIQTYTNGQITSFQEKDYELIGLPYLANIVTLQLMTLQTVIQAGSSWGYDSYDRDSFLNGANGVRDLMSKYSKHIIETFTNNLPDMSDWNKRQEYVRQMTLFCLDYVALWPTLDPELYSGEVDLDQTRALLSGTILSGSSPWDDLFIYPGEFVGVSLTPDSYHGDHFLRDLKQTWLKPDGALTGPPNPPGHLKSPVVETNLYGNSENGSTSCETFAIKDKDRNGSYISSRGGACIGDYFEGHAVAPDNHKLNGIIDISPFPFSRFTGYINVYVRENLGAPNMFGLQDSNGNVIIKGIPAEKGYIDGPRTDVAREWVNGANPVNLPNWDALDVKATNFTEGEYKIRVRFANAGPDVHLTLNLYAGQNQQKVVSNKKILFKSTACESTTTCTHVKENFPNQPYIVGEQGNYVLLDLVDSIYLPFGETRVNLGQYRGEDANKQIFIDRVEFVPITIPRPPQNIDFNISQHSPIPAFNRQDPGEFPTIWTANSGEVGHSAIITLAGLKTPASLNTPACLFAKTGQGDDSNPNNWQMMCPDDKTLPRLDNGRYKFKVNDGGCLNKSFTAIKVAAYLSGDTLSSGTITGGVNTKKN
ncbi:Pesticidal crystal protein cry14Aa [Bacillus subtilis]|nr:Pesticidal crystal protein cry14Aa [Bacillus subtilis]